MNFGYFPYNANNNLYQQQLAQQQLAQQNNMIIHVPSEDVARNYSVAPGGSVTFIDDNSPYCYTKTAGVNQFDVPTFRKFRLVEETANEQRQEQKQDNPVVDDLVQKEIEELKARIDALENKFSANQNQQNERRMKYESLKQQRQSQSSEPK